MEPRNESLPIVIIGAGPVGLAAAAHLIRRDLKPIIFERGPEVGHAVRSWSHVRIFSPWRYNIDSAAESLLKETSWKTPDPEDLPTGGELLSKYLEPLAKLPKIASAIHYNSKVTSIARKGFDKLTTVGRTEAPFEVTWIDANGLRQITLAAAVIDASGTWFSPNPMGIDGRAIQGERQASNLIHYGIPDVLGKDKNTYANKKVLVVGGGHSAINAVLELLKLQEIYPMTEVVWSIRKNKLEKILGGGLNDKLPARGALGNAAKNAIDRKLLTLLMPFAPFRVEKGETTLKVHGIKNMVEVELEMDRIIVATGFRPELDLFRELRVSLDSILEAPPALAPLIDPNLHSCGTVPPHGVKELSHPEPGFYIVGSKSYGRAPTFLMATGYEQVRSVVAELAGDQEAARDVRLVLPETGVCSTSSKKSSSVSAHKVTEPVSTQINLKTSGGCCGGPAPSADSCCIKDHEAKLAGESGCGCGSKKPEINHSIEVQSVCCA